MIYIFNVPDNDCSDMPYFCVTYRYDYLDGMEDKTCAGEATAIALSGSTYDPSKLWNIIARKAYDMTAEDMMSCFGVCNLLDLFGLPPIEVINRYEKWSKQNKED